MPYCIVLRYFVPLQSYIVPMKRAEHRKSRRLRCSAFFCFHGNTQKEHHKKCDKPQEITEFWKENFTMLKTLLSLIRTVLQQLVAALLKTIITA